MSAAKKIREWLATNQPAWPQAIADGTGMKSKAVRASLSDMKVAGILVKGEDGYSLGREPYRFRKWACATERQRHHSAVNRRKNGVRTWAEYVAAKKLPEPVVKRIREITAKVAKANKATKKAAAKKPISIRIEPRRPSVIDAKPEPVKLPCTEDFIRANPDKLIKLEPGVWSTRLRIDLAGDSAFHR